MELWKNCVIENSYDYVNSAGILVLPLLQLWFIQH